MEKGEKADYSQFRTKTGLGQPGSQESQVQAAKDVEEEEHHFHRSR